MDSAAHADFATHKQRRPVITNLCSKLLHAQFATQHAAHDRECACAVGTVIDTDEAPSALGPYSQAVKAGQTLYISGQIGFDPKTMDFAGEGVKEQAEQVHPLWQRILVLNGSPLRSLAVTSVHDELLLRHRDA